MLFQMLILLRATSVTSHLPTAIALFWEDETDEMLVHDMRERFTGRLTIQHLELRSEDLDELREKCSRVAGGTCPTVHVPGIVIRPRGTQDTSTTATTTTTATTAATTTQLSLDEFLVSTDGVATFALGGHAKLKELYRFLRSFALEERRAPEHMWRTAHVQTMADFRRLCVTRDGVCVVLFASSSDKAPWTVLGRALRGFTPQNEAFTFSWTQSFTALHAEINIAVPSSPALALIEPRRKKVAILALRKNLPAKTIRQWLEKFDITPGEYQDALYADVPPFASATQEAAPVSRRSGSPREL